MKKKTQKNIVYSMASQFFIMVLSFFNRQYFTIYLGKELLGINGVISNVLVILQLAELGIGTALTFFFYKPLLEQDYCHISKLLSYAKSIYRHIALIVAIIGVGLLPFLNLIIRTTINTGTVKMYFILFLINTLSSYFVVYKSLLLIADQKIYLINLVRTIILVGQNTIQIIIIKTTQNYYGYLAVLIIGTIINNLIITVIAEKQYGDKIRSRNSDLDKSEKQEIWTMIKSTAVYKIGVVIVNNTDNILISLLVNTVTVGLYSNYLLIASGLNTVMSTFISAITAKIGEINAGTDKEYSYKIFRIMLFLFHYITVICSLCLLFCANDFITLFFGADYTLNSWEVFAIVFSFYIMHAIDPVWIYRETMGLFNEIKFLMLWTALFNLIFSVVLGKIIGLAGIIIATGIARILTTVWYEPQVLYNKFTVNVTSYYIVQLRYLFECIIAGIAAEIIVNKLCVSYVGLVIKISIIIIISTMVTVFLNLGTAEFRNLRSSINTYIRAYQKEK